MSNMSQFKISEMAKVAGVSTPLISKYFRDFDDSKVTRVNKRIVGITPEAVEDYLMHVGLDYFYRPSIILSANLCGGVGKTSSIYNLGAAMRRITNRDTPIVYIDGDSQGSFTSMVFGEPADDNEPLLLDFLEGKVKIEEILTEVDDNIWFIKSNLNQAWIEKVLSKPKDIKNSMLNFYKEIYKHLGKETKIFQDHTPQLSSLFASSVCALCQLDESILRSVIIPMRSDKFAIQGANYIIQEIDDLVDTFSLDNDIDIHCFFSSIDRRVSTTGEALKLAKANENILDRLSSIIVRYCSEVPKSIMKSSSVFTSGKTNNAAQDYQDLLQYIYSYGVESANG
ncbi:ParA family protein [Piscirickettsia salmonis]|uniref:ParA family protein n=2 Tax=Piscirickettsia salmonis TaxID=1238 RepID=UPI003EBED99C